MKVRLIILLLLISTVSFGQDAQQEVLEKIEKINDANTGGNCKYCDDFKRPTDSEKKAVSNIEQCIDTICENTKITTSAAIEEANEKMFNSGDAVKDELNKIANDITTIDIKNDLQMLNELKTWLKENPKLKNPALVRLFNGLHYISTFNEYEVEVNGGKVKVDKNQLRTKLTGEGWDGDLESELNKRATIVNKLLALIYENDDAFDTTDPGTLRILYPGEKLKEHILSVKNSLKKRFNKVLSSEDYKPYAQLHSFQDLFNESDFNRILESGEINAEAIESINATGFALLFLEIIATDKKLKQLITDKEIDLEKYVHDNAMTTVFTYAEGAFKGKIEFAGDNGHPNCEMAYLLGQKILPSESDIADFKKKQIQFKDRFKSNMRRFLSGPSSAKLFPKVDQWFFTYPQTKEMHAKNLKKSLLSKLNDVKMDSLEIQNSTQKQKEVLFLFQMSIMNSKDYDPHESQADDTCKEHIPEIAPEASYPITGGITIGPFTLKDQGKEDVVYHEMGHLLSGEMSKMKLSQHTKKWRNDANSCLVGQHSSEEVGNEKLEEDFADLLAANMQTNPASLNMCTFYKLQPESEEYASYRLEDAEADDEHSEGLFRLLHAANIKQGNIPIACQKAVAENGEKMNFKNCAVQKK